MFSSKNVLNQSSITASNASIGTIEGLSNVYENSLGVSSNTTTTPWFPYTLDYSTGSIFYIPPDYTTTSNFNVFITNIPTDTTKVYNLTLVYYQPVNKFYCNGVSCKTTAGTYILGSSSTFGLPLFNGGAPTLSNSPCLIVQQFSIISLKTTGGTITRYITSSVSNHY